MALIKFGGGITEMRGSIAGNVYSRNRYGAYARARTKPVNPNTGYQQVVRAIVTYLTTYWSQTVTSAQRTAWNLYAANVVMLNKLGESVHLSGFNHFIRSNSARIQAGLAIVAAGPTTFELPEADESIVATMSEAAGTLSLAYDDGEDWCDEDGAGLIIRQGVPQNAQRNFFGGPFRFHACVEGDSVTAPTSPEANTATFAFVEGQRVWVSCRISRADGRLSEPFRCDCFCTS